MKNEQIHKETIQIDDHESSDNIKYLHSIVKVSYENIYEFNKFQFRKDIR